MTQDDINRMPRTHEGIANGMGDKVGQARGDLLNISNPDGPVHPDITNEVHKNNPHYNLTSNDGKVKSAIIVDDKRAEKLGPNETHEPKSRAQLDLEEERRVGKDEAAKRRALREQGPTNANGCSCK